MIAVAMLAIVATWLLLALMFFGIGRLTCWLLRIRMEDGLRPAMTFFIGWGLAIGLLQMWHFWLPVDARCLALAAALGTIGLAINFRGLRTQVTHWLVESWRHGGTGLLVVKILVVLLWANLAAGPVSRYDSGLYHLQAVRWTENYPIVPGLGNLHGRLAFNNSSFLYTAMLDVGPWEEKSQHLANGLLAIVVMLDLLSSVAHLRRADGGLDPCHAFRVLMFPLAAYFTCREVSSPQPDPVTFLLGIVVTAWLFELLLHAALPANERRRLAFAICFLSSVGLSVKLNFLPLGLLASVLALGSICLPRRPTAVDRVSRLSTAASCVLFAALLIVPWLGRGVLLSGYPLYPSKAFAVDVPWRIPVEEVDHMQVAIVGYARHQGSGYQKTIGNWRWVGAWARRELSRVVEVSLPLTCALAAAGFFIAGMMRKVWRNDAKWIPYLGLIPSIATIVFVLTTAPAYRFAGAAIWCFGVGALVLVVDGLQKESLLYQHARRLAFGLAVLLFAIGAIKSVGRPNGFGVREIFPAVPQAALKQQTTADGLLVFVPVTGDQTWNAALPAASHLHPRLAQLRPGDLGSGFYLRADDSLASEPAGPTRR